MAPGPDTAAAPQQPQAAENGVAFSKLNPNAEEFVPFSLRRLSADAPSFEYRNSIGGGLEDWFSNSSNSLPNQNRRRRYNQNQQKIRRTVYVPEVPEDMNECQLAGWFRNVGRVKECRICGDTSSTLRFAFIEFFNESQAKAALGLCGMVMPGCPYQFIPRILPSKTAILPVNRKYLPKSDDERERTFRTVYCTNVDRKVSQIEVTNFFEQLCGEVTCLRLLLDVKNFTSIAFVEFAQVDGANLALHCSGRPLGDLPIRVSPSKTPVRPFTLTP